MVWKSVIHKRLKGSGVGLSPPEQEGDNEHHLSGVVLQGLSAFQAKTVASVCSD